MGRKLENEPRYSNDDYSPYAGPDFHYHHNHLDFPDRISLGQGYGNYDKPGLSGKDRNGGTWLNNSEFNMQKNYIGKGPKGYRRQDAYVYEEVCEALKRDPYINAEEIEVEVHKGQVTLKGFVPSRAIKREAEECIENLSGVEDVFNMLKIGYLRDLGSEGIIKNQSGL